MSFHLMVTAQDVELAMSWITWARRIAPGRSYDLRDPPGDRDVVLLGLFIQASAEQPVEFARIHAAVLGPERTHPLTSVGEGALVNLLRNGVGDDWEIYLQWTDLGYVVVNEDLRQPQDARIRPVQARRLLDTITGGLRAAPGLADEGELVQSFYELEPF